MRWDRRGPVGLVLVAVIAGSVGLSAIPAHAHESVRAEVSRAKAPFSGTVWISPNVLTATDPTDLQSTEYVGLQKRRTYDRRDNRWVDADMHVIQARYGCGLRTVEILVNTEFDKDQAWSEADRFASVHGQMPPGLRYAVHEIWIHGGNEPAGGGNRSVLVHTEYADTYWDFIEEVWLHEAAHTTLDFEAHGAGGVDRDLWMAARSDDGRPISDYAGEFPDREDVAESYGAYAVWKVAQRSSSRDRNAAIIADTIPHRLDYLDSLGEEYQPGTDSCPTVTPQAPTNPRAATRGRFTTVSWTPPEPAVSVSHYEWRVASRVSGLGAWTAFGHARTSSLALRNQGRGNRWIVEVRAMWGSEPGPPFRLRYRS